MQNHALYNRIFGPIMVRNAVYNTFLNMITMGTKLLLSGSSKIGVVAHDPDFRARGLRGCPQMSESGTDSAACVARGKDSATEAARG